MREELDAAAAAGGGGDGQLRAQFAELQILLSWPQICLISDLRPA